MTATEGRGNARLTAPSLIAAGNAPIGARALEPGPSPPDENVDRAGTLPLPFEPVVLLLGHPLGVGTAVDRADIVGREPDAPEEEHDDAPGEAPRTARQPPGCNQKEVHGHVHGKMGVESTFSFAVRRSTSRSSSSVGMTAPVPVIWRTGAYTFGPVQRQCINPYQEKFVRFT